jgi:DNA-binding transcriptional MocR family regulator
MDTSWRPDLSDASGPLYRALADAICTAVSDGAIAGGARLPPVRELAWEMRVSPGAVARAYRIATDRGALEATVGRGTFARAAGRPAYAMDALVEPPPPDKIDLRGNRAVDVGQDAEITAALRRLLDRAGGPLPMTDYRKREDDPAAHEALAAWLRTGGAPAEAERLIVTSGAQEGVIACLIAAARGGQGVALTETLVHPGLRDAAEAIGVRLEPVARDGQGLIPEAFDAACARLRPDAALLTATFHNPTLSFMEEARRREIVAIARARDVALIEDDVYGWLVEPRPPCFAALAPERAWYVTSLSKCVAAGLRAGFVLPPPGRMRETLRAHQGVAHHIPWLTTALAAELASSGDLDRIRARVREETRARATLAARALGRFGARADYAASFVWLPMPEIWSSGEFAAAAAARGVLVAPRSAYVVGRAAAGPDFVRLALGARADRAALGQAFDRLAALLEEGPDRDAPPT